MSISSAISSALVGMGNNIRSAEVIASNVANANDASYSRREFDNGLVKRITNPVLLQDRRLSDADSGRSAATLEHANRIEAVFGQIDDPTSLTGALAEFDSALVLASGDPSSDIRLENVVKTAGRLASAFNTTERNLQSIRAQADAEIDVQVGRLNARLTEIANLNSSISIAKHGDIEVSSLMDQRQRAIDDIAQMVPIKTVARDRGELTIYTTGGVVLVGDRASEVGFEPTPIVTSAMTNGNGLLGGLSVNGKTISTQEGGPFSGGSIAAQFEVRDKTIPALQAELDDIAIHLAQGFGSDGPDGTIATGAPGLFTDAGSVPIQGDSGVAGRLQLNTQVSLADAWRMRDGLYAATTGEVGNSTLLSSMTEALQATNNSGPNQSLADRISDLGARAVTLRVNAQQDDEAAQSRNITLRELENTGGVDTDQELQKLLMVEQSYAANAQVLSTLDDLINKLLDM